MPTRTYIGKAIASFENLTALVVGDVMIDAYMWGNVDRISPEAPVPVIGITERENRLGGAANVALNLKTLGATPIICSIIGEDSYSSTFNELLKDRGFTDAGLIRDKDRKTTVKTRIISGGQHLLRVDEEDHHFINKAQEKALFARISELLESGQVDVIIFEDYNKGVLTSGLIQAVVQEARSRNIPTTVDPKKENFFAYKNVTLFKPNLKELREGLKLDIKKGDKQELIDALNMLEKELNNEISLLTLSEHGILIKKGSETASFPAHLREILDVSGAGDTVISVASLALAAGLSIRDIARLSNLAGGLVCEKLGVVPIDKEQLLEEATQLRIDETGRMG